MLTVRGASTRLSFPISAQHPVQCKNGTSQHTVDHLYQTHTHTHIATVCSTKILQNAAITEACPPNAFNPILSAPVVMVMVVMVVVVEEHGAPLERSSVDEIRQPTETFSISLSLQHRCHEEFDGSSANILTCCILSRR